MRILFAPEAPPAAGAPPKAPATPPPSPSPAPAPTPPTPPAAPAAPAAPDDPVRAFDDKIAAAFDKDMGTTPEPKAGEPPKPAPAPSKPAAPAPAAPAPAKPAANQLRAELERVSGELTTKTTQIGDLEKKIADYEAKGKDTTALSERLATLEKQMEAKDAELRALKHEASPEYKAKYEAPFNRAASLARRDVEQLQVTNPETGEARAATFDDFTEIYRLPYAKALPRAKELFGEGAQIVVNHVQKLRDMEYEAQQALEEEKSSYKQREEADRARSVQTRQQVGKLWQKVVSELGDSVDDYKVDPTDKELLSARDEAFSIFDAKAATLDEQVVKNAHIRHSFAALRVAKLKMMRMAKEMQELKSELDTYKTEPPNPGRRPGGKESAHGDSGKDWESGLREAITA